MNFVHMCSHDYNPVAFFHFQHITCLKMMMKMNNRITLNVTRDYTITPMIQWFKMMYSLQMNTCTIKQKRIMEGLTKIFQRNVSLFVILHK